MTVVRLVDESDRGQIRRLLFWLLPSHPISEGCFQECAKQPVRKSTNMTVVRLVDESDRGQIRRLLFWLFTCHVISEGCFQECAKQPVRSSTNMTVVRLVDESDRGQGVCMPCDFRQLLRGVHKTASAKFDEYDRGKTRRRT
jgi:hypothetical protein